MLKKVYSTDDTAQLSAQECLTNDPSIEADGFQYIRLHSSDIDMCIVLRIRNCSQLENDEILVPLWVIDWFQVTPGCLVSVSYIEKGNVSIGIFYSLTINSN